MSASVSIDFEGLEEVLSKFKSWPAGMRRAVAQAIGRSLQLVRNEAVRTAPVDTGRYRASIGAQAGPGANLGIFQVKETKQTIIGRVGTRVEYAPYLEFGTRRMRAFHTLERAMRSQAKKIVELIEQTIERAARRF